MKALWRGVLLGSAQKPYCSCKRRRTLSTVCCVRFSNDDCSNWIVDSSCVGVRRWYWRRTKRCLARRFRRRRFCLFVGGGIGSVSGCRCCVVVGVCRRVDCVGVCRCVDGGEGFAICRDFASSGDLFVARCRCVGPPWTSFLSFLVRQVLFSMQHIVGRAHRVFCRVWIVLSE